VKRTKALILEKRLKRLSLRVFGVIVVLFVMGRVIGYMVTWTTYGSWLQGDRKGWVKDGEVRGGCEELRKANKMKMGQKKVALSRKAQEVVRGAILEEAEKTRQKIFAISVKATHVHIVGEAIEELIETVVARYKAAGRKALSAEGYTGRIWARGYDKRYCFDEEELKARVEYVNKHKR